MARQSIAALLSLISILVLTISYNSEANSIGEAFQNAVDLEEADGWPKDLVSEDQESSKIASVDPYKDNGIDQGVAKRFADRAAELREEYGSFRVKRA